MQLKKLFLITVLLTVTTHWLKAQVTIGYDAAPEKAALLQIKTEEPVAKGDITSKKGGLLLPRVQLVSLNQLFPFFDSSLQGDPDYENNEKPAHKALIVYHIGTTDIEEGVYVWNGETWGKLLAPEPVEDAKTINQVQLFYRTLNDTKRGASASNPALHTGYKFVIPANTLQPDGTFIDYMFRWARTGGGVDAWWGIVRFSTSSTTFNYNCPGTSEYVETGRIIYNRGSQENNSDATLSIIGADGSEKVLTGIYNNEPITVELMSYTVGVATTVTMDYARFVVSLTEVNQ